MLGDMLVPQSSASQGAPTVNEQTVHFTKLLVSTVCFFVERKAEAHYSRGRMHLEVNTLRICSRYHYITTEVYSVLY